MRSWSVCLLLAAGSARAEFAVLDGPFAGLSTPSPPLAVSSPRFDVAAELVASNESEWSYASCPPQYLGRQPLAGRLVLITSMPLLCSRKELGQALLDHRAAGLVFLERPTGPIAWPRRAVAGRWYYSHSAGEDRAPLPLSVTHIVGPGLLELYESVRGGARVRARVTPSENPWLAMWCSAWWTVWQAANTLPSVAILELAVLRLYAFIRETGRPQLTIPCALLLIEIVAHLQRIAFLGVDPYWSRGVYSEQASLWLSGNHVTLSLLGRGLFLVFFTQAADHAGIATFRVARRGPALVVTCAAILAVDAATFYAALRSNTNLFIRLLIIGMLLPTLELALYLLAYRRVVRKLKRLPVLLLNKVKTVMGRTCTAIAVALFVGSLGITVSGPIVEALTLCIFHAAINAASFMQVVVFKPLGVPVPVGPLGLVYGLLARSARQLREFRVRLARQRRAKPSAAAQLRRTPRRAMSVAPLRSASKGSAGSEGEPMEWLRLGTSLRFARECIWALDLDEAASAAAVRGVMVDQFARFEGACRRSVVELYERTRTLNGEAAVGGATVLVLHAPEMTFAQLTEAVADYATQSRVESREIFFWLAAFSRRNEPLVRREALEMVRLVRAIGRVAIALPRWDSPLPDLELIAQAVQLDEVEKVEICIALPGPERARYARALAEASEETREEMLAATSPAVLQMLLRTMSFAEDEDDAPPPRAMNPHTIDGYAAAMGGAPAQAPIAMPPLHTINRAAPLRAAEEEAKTPEAVPGHVR